MLEEYSLRYEVAFREIGDSEARGLSQRTGERP